MSVEHSFMVEFDLPRSLSEEFMDLLPVQRHMVDQLFEDGVLVNYAMSLENSKLWAVFNAPSEIEVREYILAMPLSKFLSAEVHLLTQYNAPQEQPPVFSLN